MRASTGLKTGGKKAEYLLKRLDLEDAKDKLVEEYSTEMRKKLLLAKALIHDPKVLLLDEVLNGLDPRAVTEVISSFGSSTPRELRLCW
ncbi:ATP-binding cassette domain-containing protein [Pyrococcus kukulkanii]|uniref:ATP-binding cassette domain-containing protein n=1 Tax=Pyrococcus kukulkanii TaxID=1609559 RepID=UPI003565E677